MQKIIITDTQNQKLGDILDQFLENITTDNNGNMGIKFSNHEVRISNELYTGLLYLKQECYSCTDQSADHSSIEFAKKSLINQYMIVH